MALNPVTSHPDLLVQAVMTKDAVNYTIDGLFRETPTESPEGTRIQMTSFTTDPQAKAVSMLQPSDFAEADLLVNGMNYKIRDTEYNHSAGTVGWSSLNLRLQEAP